MRAFSQFSRRDFVFQVVFKGQPHRVGQRQLQHFGGDARVAVAGRRRRVAEAARGGRRTNQRQPQQKPTPPPRHASDVPRIGRARTPHGPNLLSRTAIV